MFQDWSAREQLAAIAMHALVQSSGDGLGAVGLARRAYEIADALIAENSRDPQSRLSANESGEGK